jgi:hypothetical protein
VVCRLVHLLHRLPPVVVLARPGWPGLLRHRPARERILGVGGRQQAAVGTERPATHLAAMPRTASEVIRRGSGADICVLYLPGWSRLAPRGSANGDSSSRLLYCSGLEYQIHQIAMRWRL